MPGSAVSLLGGTLYASQFSFQLKGAVLSKSIWSFHRQSNHGRALVIMRIREMVIF